MQTELAPTITPQTQLAPTEGGNNSSRVTRSSLNKKQLGGNGAVTYTTSKALRETAAKKRVRNKTQQDGNSQVIFLAPLCVNITISDYLMHAIVIVLFQDPNGI